MRTISGTIRTAVCGAALMLMALPGISAAAAPGGTGGMQQGASGDHGGMKTDDHGKMQSGGHDMAKMGDKAFSGKIGPWKGDARIMDMKAHLVASGMKAQGAMPNSHHIAFTLTDAAKKPVTEGKGTVTITGPDKKTATAVHGHAGALAPMYLPSPGSTRSSRRSSRGARRGALRSPILEKDAFVGARPQAGSDSGLRCGVDAHGAAGHFGGGGARRNGRDAAGRSRRHEDGRSREDGFGRA